MTKMANLTNSFDRGLFLRSRFINESYNYKIIDTVSGHK